VCREELSFEMIEKIYCLTCKIGKDGYGTQAWKMNMFTVCEGV